MIMIIHTTPMAFITRLQVARLLGVTVGQVCKYDGKYLEPVRVPSITGRMRPSVYYDEIEVELAKKEIEVARIKPRILKPVKVPFTKGETTWRGKLAKKLFQLFENNASFADAVKETEADPAIVREFYDDFHSSPEERAALKAIEDANEFSFRKYRYKTSMALREKELTCRELEARAALKALDLAEQGKLDIRSYEKLLQEVHDRYQQTRAEKKR